MTSTERRKAAGPTPGPWTVNDGGGQYRHEVIAQSPRGKTVVVARIGGGPKFREGNARLIAAAQDMLAELQRLLSRHGEQATADVITKATGAQP